MEIKPIRDDADYEAALAEVEAAWDAPPGSPEADRLDVLATLVAEYERRRIPIEAPDPVEAVLFRMEQLGLNPRDLEPYIGSRGRLSEVLNRRRGFSLAMIRRLHAGLGIPAEVLIQSGPWIAEIPALEVTVMGATREEAAENATLAGQRLLGSRRMSHAIRIIQASVSARQARQRRAGLG